MRPYIRKPCRVHYNGNYIHNFILYKLNVRTFPIIAASHTFPRIIREMIAIFRVSLQPYELMLNMTQSRI